MKKLLYFCTLIFIIGFFVGFYDTEISYGASCSNPGKGNDKSPYYSNDNKLGLHPTLKDASDRLISEAKSKLNLEISIIEGFRSVEYQDYLYSQGRDCGGSIVTNASGSDGSSYHMYGLAFDFVFKDGAYDTKKDRNSNGKDDWKEVGELGESYGLEWGGNWKSFVDLPHFQYTYGLTTKQLKNGELPPEGSAIEAGGSTNSDVSNDILSMEAYVHISLFDDYESEISNIGVNDKKNHNTSEQIITTNKFVNILIKLFLNITWILGIFAFGYISILWLVVLLARTKMEYLYKVVDIMTMGKIDAFDDFGKLIKLTIIFSLFIVISVSGLLPLVFAAIYKGFSIFISFVFRL